MRDINYPSSKTWFIANTGDQYSYGCVDVDQCMTTGLDEVQLFYSEESFLNKLNELGIESQNNATSPSDYCNESDGEPYGDAQPPDLNSNSKGV